LARVSAKPVQAGPFGAGVEYAISKNWSARFEYRHSDFGSATYAASNFAGNRYTIRVDDNALRAGIAYYF
jgi:outer membrane immunogenic protein